jgi:hypothetical protein
VSDTVYEFIEKDVRVVVGESDRWRAKKVKKRMNYSRNPVNSRSMTIMVDIDQFVR